MPSESKTTIAAMSSPACIARFRNDVGFQDTVIGSNQGSCCLLGTHDRCPDASCAGARVEDAITHAA
jgi:hypothetical protein